MIPPRPTTPPLAAVPPAPMLPDLVAEMRELAARVERDGFRRGPAPASAQLATEPAR